MREGLHLFLCETREIPGFHPWPSPDVGDRVFTLTGTGKIFTRFICVLPREANFEDTVNSQCLILEALDGVFASISCRSLFASLLVLTWNLFLGKLSKVVDLTLIWSTVAYQISIPVSSEH